MGSPDALTAQENAFRLAKGRRADSIAREGSRVHARRQVGFVIYRAATDLVAKAALFVVTIAAARTLSQGDFGLFSLATTTGWMVALAGDFGIQMHLARAVAQHPETAALQLRRWLPIRALTAALGVIGMAIGAAITVDSWAATIVLVLFTLLYVVNGLVEFLYYFYRGLGRTDLESALVLAQRLTVLALALTALRWRPSLILLALAMLAPAVGGLFVAGRIASRLTPSDRHSPPQPWSFMPGDALGRVLPIGAGIVLSALYFRIDVFLLEAWQGLEAVGHYNAVFRIVEALRLLPAAALAVAMPTLFTAVTRRPLVQLATALTGSAVVVTLVLWFSGGWAVTLLLGDRYAPAIPAFRVLTLSFPLMSLNYALTHQLIGWHGHRFYALLCATALVINIGTNALLIPLLGLVGAAWTTLITEAVVTAGCVLGLRLSTPDATLRTTVGAMAVTS